MQRYLLQRAAELEAQSPAGEEQVGFTESLAAYAVEQLSGPGAVVLDPFAGFGTTLVVAERLGRRPLGVELLPDRVAHARARVADPGCVVEGDAREVDRLVEGPVDLVLTSPPYRTRNDHPEDPLAAYERDGGGYDAYLAELGDVFARLAGLLRPGGHVAVNVANLQHDGVLTTLAWDLAREIGRHLALVHATYLAWDSLPPDLAADYLLVFGGD